MKEYKVIFCVFCGRERYMNILQKYINDCLDKKIINEYHMMNFTKNMKDFNYIINLGESLKKKYGEERIKIHHSEETETMIRDKEWRPVWDEFYKRIGKEIGDEKSVIIKCDDDILFFDVYQLERACQERWEDRESWLIHSNCINNGVCAYYQKDKFKSIQHQLEEYPRGGICGPIFENPRIAFIQHYQFVKDLLKDPKEIEKYYLEKDIFISTRISINFIFLHGQDIEEIQKVGRNDEYQISSKIPERLLRPNRILSDFVTSHYSYGMQDRLLQKQNQNIDLYQKLSESYLSNHQNIFKSIFYKKKEHIKKKILEYPTVYLQECQEENKEIIMCKNPIKQDEYYIKHEDTGLYLFYDKIRKLCFLSKENKSYFQWREYGKLTKEEEEKKIMKIGPSEDGRGKVFSTIHYFIYPFTKYSFPYRLTDEKLYSKTIMDKREIEIELIESRFCEGYKIRFRNSGEYLSYKCKFQEEDDGVPEVCVTMEDNEDRWIFEKVRKENDPEIIEVERIYSPSFDSYFYKNRDTGDDITNPYYGWNLETLFS